MVHDPTLPDRNSFPNLKDKVVVVVGGASGIGAALTTLLYTHGANVVLGDINSGTGEALVKSLLKQKEQYRTAASSGTATFVFCDVCKYSDIYGLFRTALDKHHHVDHAVFCAGIVDSPGSPYFDMTLSVDAVGKDPGSTRTLEVNFLGACAFARIALTFLRNNSTPMTLNLPSSNRNHRPDRSMTFLSSVTGFRDAPGMFLYQTSKQAILGLMRAMRTTIFANGGIRVNAVCPGMTETPMTSATGLIELFKNRPEANTVIPSSTSTSTPPTPTPTSLPSHYQSSTAVAEHVATIMLMESLNGASIYVEEGKGWEFEVGMAREMPRWLGEEPTRLSDENLRFLESLGGP
ncbi:uncharacterized protein A1O9_11320 [Exophiala aquamarina CBS 119918]|uniref:3-hydroxyacyl-CoA dehydrogenase n=1 Tax=Exophiala aquamarina CBS 119918 TaxID=1182545 RepID=A0A072NZM3_9EURO|nr:uncharacterized protein A1O9_11320 [Exophiala aquamarina CBS 119918]KEF52478.1 hypothetical protein A1O9_11320 [Exophiala aquamarina CBS 119918]